MNPRQRRGVILMALAVVGGVAVFLAVSNFVAEVRTQVGPLITALELDADLTAYEPVTADRVTEVTLPQRWAPRGALTDEVQVAGMVASSDLPGGTLLQTGMLVPQPALEVGQREIAIMVDAETGVAGKIGPGSRVDVYANFAGTETDPPQSLIVVQNALVIDVGVIRQEADPDTFATQDVVPVTFALSIEESLQVSYVESFAAKVRLALRAPNDLDEIPPAQQRFQPFPPARPAE